ncbi:adenine deaminase [Salsuginibacillus halophilus]|uniref:Adenine deaminase n=1 Tax=Salsuginibacillus halophilus TaxID=517424 RepID=A0A2P8HLJ1_9BACI|nr:adenine deaminase [Salsuginibacillus halophilus]PSL47051.1 adenine deaminase [Salsuginibacillus halophilus]
MTHAHDSHLERQIKAASGEIPADCVIKNAVFADVFNRTWERGDIAIQDGNIAGIGTFSGRHEVDAKGYLLAPGWIDGHVHIESSMVTPAEFAKAVLPQGVTTVITDPHEIANVSGTEGIDFMINESRKVPLDIKFMLPSSVPAAPLEDNGSRLDAVDLMPYYDTDEVLGLAEVMDYPAVAQTNPDMMKKLDDASRRNRPIDGHAAGLSDEHLNVYAAAGIRSDHEAVTYEEGRARLLRGMYLMLREGSGAKDVRALLPLVHEGNAHRCLFVTDDKHMDEILQKGSIGENIRIAVAEGVAPITALAMASLHAAECFQMHHKGAIAPGRDADFVWLTDLESFSPAKTWVKGKEVAADHTYTGPAFQPPAPPKSLAGSVHSCNLNQDHLDIPIRNNEAKARVMGVSPGSIMTSHSIESVPVENELFTPGNGFNKLISTARHRSDNKTAAGIVKGLGTIDGAVASTIAHDAHNVIACGSNDTDIALAVETLNELQGGIAITQDGTVLFTLPLPISGLLSDRSSEEVAHKLEAMQQPLADIGFTGNFDPIIALSFLSLPVIPELKLTVQGLYDVTAQQLVSVDPYRNSEQ